MNHLSASFMSEKTKHEAFLIFVMLLLGSFLPLAFDTIMPAEGDTPPFPTYPSFVEIEQELKELAEEHSNILELYELNRSWENRSIWAVKVSDNPESIEAEEPGLLFFGGLHAMQLISVRVSLDLIRTLVREYDTNGTIARLIDTREIWIVPLVNPDGYEYNLSGHEWRKNRRIIDLNGDGDALDTGEGIGVDLNRNWGHRWGEGSGFEGSDQPSSEYYMGPAPFSEPETQALRDLVNSRDFVFSVSFQSYGQQITFPWGNDVDEPHSSLPLLENVSRQLERRTGYASQQAKENNVTFGGGDDWLLAEGGALPFTVWLGDDHAPQQEEDQIKISNAQVGAALYLMGIAEEPEKSQHADWNWLVYMAADGSLHNQGLEDINWMEYVGSSQAVNIIVLFDGIDNDDSRIYHIQKDGLGFNTNIISPVLDDGGAVIPPSNEVDTSDPDTVQRFLNWSLEMFPAHHTLLSIWGHGEGVIKGSAYDSGLGYITLPELRRALENVSIAHPSFHLDILGMDVCNLGGIETFEELASVASFLVASEDEEPGFGWPEHITLQKLVANPLMIPEDLSRTVVEDYHFYYEFRVDYTQAAGDLYQYQRKVAPAWDDFSLALKTYFYHHQDLIRSHQENSTLYHLPESDIGDFAQRIGNDDNLPTVLRESAQRFWEIYQGSILAETHGVFTPNATGLSVYFPETKVDAFYENEMRVGLHRIWLDFLKTFADPVPLPLIEHGGVNYTYTMGTAPPINGSLLVPEEHPDIQNISLTLYHRVNQGEPGDTLVSLEDVTEGNDGVPEGMKLFSFSMNFPSIKTGTFVQYFLEASDAKGNFTRCPYNVDTLTWENSYQFVIPLDLEVHAFALDEDMIKEVYTEGELLNFTAVVRNIGELAWEGKLTFLLQNATISGEGNGGENGVNTTPLKSYQVFLQPDDEEEIHLSWLSLVGNWTISAQVSLVNFTMDENGSNNMCSIKIAVLPQEDLVPKRDENDEGLNLAIVALVLVTFLVIVTILLSTSILTIRRAWRMKKSSSLRQEPHLVRASRAIPAEIEETTPETETEDLEDLIDEDTEG